MSCSVDPDRRDGGPGVCGDPVQGAGHHCGGHLLCPRGLRRPGGKASDTDGTKLTLLLQQLLLLLHTGSKLVISINLHEHTPTLQSFLLFMCRCETGPFLEGHISQWTKAKMSLTLKKYK